MSCISLPSYTLDLLFFQKDDESCMPTGAGGSLYTPVTGGYNSRKLPLETAASNPVPSVAALPFSNWSLGGNKDNIW